MTFNAMPLSPRPVRLLLASLLALAGLGSVAHAYAYTGHELSKLAKIPLERARQIALKAHPGSITDEELEREPGGSKLRYSFDILAGGVTQEVGVDARTGRVLENKTEGAHPD